VSDFSRVKIEQIRRAFGRQPVLAGIDAELRSGELTVLMGPNGAGKSTLFGLLSTLSRPTSGRILYGNRDHRYAAIHLRHRIGLLSHGLLLYGELTCLENLIFFAKIYRMEDPLGVASQWLEAVGMTYAAHRPVRELSRGMGQRVALARALMPDPKLLLLDEPFTGLDQAATGLLRRFLSLARDSNKIVVVVTHDVEAVSGLVDRLLILDRGHIALDQAVDRPPATQLLEHYRGTVG
jgi:heme exporter protein A